MASWKHDPILDVGPGARTRQVPIEVPADCVFVELIPAHDRWIGHFRRRAAYENAAFTQQDYAYYELQPQNASPAYRLNLTGEVPNFIAYESTDGGKLVLLSAEELAAAWR